MARRATIQLKVHRQIVQSIPLDEADIECLIQGLRLVTPEGPRTRHLAELNRLGALPDGRSQELIGIVNHHRCITTRAREI
jgi:hypothetical protein